MKYTCIIIRYNLCVRNFLTKGLGTRTYSTFQRERKSETIMLISNCAELLALFLKKINNLLLQCKKLLPGLSAKSTTGRTAEMNVDFYVIGHWPSTPFRKNIQRVFILVKSFVSCVYLLWFHSILCNQQHQILWQPLRSNQ